MSVIASNNQNPKAEIPLLNMFVQIKEQHRGDQMTPGPKSQLLAGIVVDTIPGPVSLCIICKKKKIATLAAGFHDAVCVMVF